MSPKRNQRTAALVLWAGIFWSASVCTSAVNQDGFSAIFWRNLAADNNSVWFMPQIIPEQDGQYIVPAQGVLTPTDTPCCWHIVAAADFNRDGQSDLLWRDAATGQTAIWLMNGTTLVAANSFPINKENNRCATVDSSWEVVGVADFDGDGYSDIVWRQPTSNTTAVWYLDLGGTNTTRNSVIPYHEGGGDWKLRAVGDFNQDGLGDLVWQNDISRQIAIWHMRNTNRLDGPVLTDYPAGSGWIIAGAGSFNPVGHTDLFWRNTTATTQNMIWWMHDTVHVGTFPCGNLPSNWEVGGIAGYSNVMALTAAALLEPKTLTLNWRFGDQPLPTIRRRVFGTTAWTTLTNNYRPQHYTNLDLTVGERYEFLVGETNYLLTAIAGKPDPLEAGNRQVILVVANDLTNFLSTDLEIFRTNLIGDGWTVLRTNVAPHDDSVWNHNIAPIASIKEYVRQVYASDPSRTKSVLLIGHGPIPYAGCCNPDGHGDRPLPADGYYVDLDGDYHDATPPCSGALVVGAEARHASAANDGKWDEVRFSAPLKMSIGRIDFAKLPALAVGPETDLETQQRLLRQYLAKNLRYRRGELVLANRAVVGSHFRAAVSRYYQEALKNSSRIFGASPHSLVLGDCLAPTNSGVFGMLAGQGSSDQITGLNGVDHTAASLRNANNEPKVLFTALFGSYLMDFGYTNALIRCLLATPNYGLAASWWSAFDWIYARTHHTLCFEQLGLGETIGSAMLRTINSQADINVETIYISLQGDPTLRLQIVRPVSNLTHALADGVKLTWSESPDTSQSFVYRSTTGIDGHWTKLTPAPVTGLTFTDFSPPPGPKLYQVRASNLQLTPSGSYTNLSQGAFVLVN
ncbi:MAG: FG-GAP-like repeat-containing protein [Verrucomicrobiota bacterium]